MNDVQFNAAALARHKDSVERYAKRHPAVAFEPTVPAPLATSRPAPAAITPMTAKVTLPPAAIATKAAEATPAAPVPTLSESQMALLEQSFVPTTPTAQPAAAVAPATAAPTSLETKAKAAAAKVELTRQQSALLAQSLGLSGTSAVPQQLADAGVPVAKEVSAVPIAKARDAALSPDQMALLMTSFGVSGQPAMPAEEAGAEEPEPAKPTAKPTATPPVPAATASDARFFPIKARGDTAGTAVASDAYLKAVQTMEQNMGRYGR